MPIDIVNIAFNFDTPAPPSGHSNVVFQDDGGSPLIKVSAFDPLMIGDSGSGGLSGNVPAPGTGDAAAGKYLDASGAWSVPPAPSPSAGWSSGNDANGYWVKDPLGHIHQWGIVGTDINGGSLGVTFPTNFSNSSSISVVVTTKSSTDRITYVVDGSVGTSGFTIANNGSSGYAYWTADGY